MIVLAAIAILAMPQDQVGIDQIGPARPAPAIEQASRGQGSEPVRQIGPSTPSVETRQQAADNRPTQQLNASGATAAAPAGPGRSERTVAVSEITGGKDLCDSADREKEEVCANAIETRSAEFAPPAAEQPTAESVLLSNMRSSTGSASKLTTGGAESDVDLAVAAETTLRPQEQEKPKSDFEKLPPNVQEAVSFTLQMLQGVGR